MDRRLRAGEEDRPADRRRSRDVPELLAGSTFPESQAQLSADLLGGGTAKAIAGTAEFLKEQKRVPAVLGDYSPYVSADFVRQAEQVQVGQR